MYPVGLALVVVAAVVAAAAAMLLSVDLIQWLVEVRSAPTGWGARLAVIGVVLAVTALVLAATGAISCKVISAPWSPPSRFLQRSSSHSLAAGIWPAMKSAARDTGSANASNGRY